MRKLLSVAVLCVALLPVTAFADDSSAALGAGGVVFTKGTGIRMAVEDLFLSPDAVRIRYEFANDSAKDVDTLVAFPLPDIDNWEYYESPMGRTTNDAINFVDFKAVADGKPVSVQVEQRAILDGKDVTAAVTRAGLPVNILINRNIDRLDHLPAAKKKALERARLVVSEGEYEHPRWITRTKFYWRQKFPAHKTVVLQHSYKPVTGQSFFGASDLTDKAQSDYYTKNFCIDAPTRRAIRAALAAHARRNAHTDMQDYLQAYTTDFILVTANNWNGPIGHFHMVLDKLKPANILSLCWDGELKKIGATRFESTRENFAPTHDIKLVVLE